MCGPSTGAIAVRPDDEAVADDHPGGQVPRTGARAPRRRAPGAREQPQAGRHRGDDQGQHGSHSRPVEDRLHETADDDEGRRRPTTIARAGPDREPGRRVGEA